MLRNLRATNCVRGFCAMMLILLGVACAGCGSTSPVAKVHGKVEIDGRPLATGFIVTRPNSGRGAKGVIKDGEFELGTYTDNDGALLGTHAVGIVANEPSQGSGPEAKAGKSLIPARYNSPDSSQLSIEVESGTNTPTLKLTSP